MNPVGYNLVEHTLRREQMQKPSKQRAKRPQGITTSLGISVLGADVDVDTQLAMNPSEFADVIERLLIRLEGGRSATVSSRAERVNIRSVVGAWFGEYRSAFLQTIGDEQLPAPMDGLLQEDSETRL